MKLIAVFFAALSITACTRSSDALRINTQAPPQPLPSSPSGSVEIGELNQLPNANPETPGSTPGQSPFETADIQTPNSAETEIASTTPVTHEAMTGAWNVNSDNPSCRIFLSFTKWSGGYRAGTRRCNTPALSSVSAWDVKGNRVVLVDSNGAQVASLGSAGQERYAGSLAGGQPITFSR